MTQTPASESIALRRASAAAIALASLATLALAMIHPTVGPHGHAGAGFLALTGWVHGAFLLASGLLVFGFWGFAEQLGLSRPTVRAGFLAYATGAFAHIGAGLVNGFVVRDMLSLAAAPERLEALRPALVFAALLNRNLSLLGAFSLSLAMVLWSFALMAGRPRRPVLAAIGLVTGLVTPALLMLGIMKIDVHGLLAQMALLAAFALPAAWLLARDER